MQRGVAAWGAWGCSVRGAGLHAWCTRLQARCRLELGGGGGGGEGAEGRGGGEAPASAKKATKTGAEETWSSCRKSLREEVKLTM